MSDRSDLYASETAYLDCAIRVAETHLERLQDNPYDAADERGTLASHGEQTLAATYETQQRVLNLLRDDPRRREHGLAGLLSDSLRDADRRLMELGRLARASGSYDPAFWRIEQERNIRAAVLREWWHWLHGLPPAA